MTKLANWGRWVVAANIVFLALLSLRGIAVEGSQIHGQHTFDQLIRVVLLGLLDIAFYSYLIWGLWKKSGLTYWLLVALNLLYFVSFGLRLFSGHFQELTILKWSYLAATLIMLAWLALPSVYEEYWRKKHPS